MRIMTALVILLFAGVSAFGCNDDSEGTEDNDSSGGGVDIDNEGCDSAAESFCAEQDGAFECITLAGEPTCACPEQVGCECPEGWRHMAQADEEETVELCIDPDHSMHDGSDDPNGNDPTGNDPTGNDPTGNDPQPDPEDCEVLTSSDVADGGLLEANSCYIAEEVLEITSGTLVIEEGVTIGFQSENPTEFPALEIKEGGSLEAIGTSGNEIHMSGALPFDDSGTYWGGIEFEGSRADNRLENVEITGPISALSMDGTAIQIDRSNVTIVDSVVREATKGLHIQSEQVDELTEALELVIDGNRFEDIEEVPIITRADHVGQIGTDNEFIDVGVEKIWISFHGSETMKFDTTWPDLGLPYYLGSDPTEAGFGVDGVVRLAAEASLTIEPGVEVLFDAEQSFYVYGDLIAEGDPGQEIRFLWHEFDNPDDDIGWRGIDFRGDTESVIRHAEIRDMYLFGNYESAISFSSPYGGEDWSPSLLLEDTVIRNAPTGIEISHGDVELLSCQGVEYIDVDEEIDNPDYDHWEHLSICE